MLPQTGPEFRKKSSFPISASLRLRCDGRTACTVALPYAFCFQGRKNKKPYILYGFGEALHSGGFGPVKHEVVSIAAGLRQKFPRLPFEIASRH
jgi:hypothetical protein